MTTTRRPASRSAAPRTASTRASLTDVLLGALLVAAGAILLGGVWLKLIPSIPALSAYVFVAGLVSILGALVGRTSAGFFTEIVSGALIAMLGGVLIRYPEQPITSLLILAGTLFAVNGVVRVASATEYPSLRGVLLAAGAASLALALAVFSDAVARSFFSLGTLVGVALIIDGVCALLIGRAEHPHRG